jgi:hypothetical protein
LKTAPDRYIDDMPAKKKQYPVPDFPIHGGLLTPAQREVAMREALALVEAPGFVATKKYTLRITEARSKR